jgi:hypothetical protein
MKAMTSRERVRAAIEHRQPDRLPVDFGASFITGIHCSVVDALRRHYKLEPRPVRICEPYQMLGLVEDDLKEVMGIDTTPIFPNRTIFGFVNENWKPWRTHWGQDVLVSEHFEWMKTRAEPTSTRRATARLRTAGTCRRRVISLIRLSGRRRLTRTI